MKGMHKKTGVKLDMPLHQLFVVNKNNKIKSITSYNNGSIFDEIGSSSDTRKNGMIYNHHDYINKVRLMIHSFENKDFNKSYSFYDIDAKFRSINMSPDDKSLTLDQMKDNDKKLMSQFDITSIDVVGYPEYLNYEMGNQKVVQSWWNFKMTRKSDNKKIVMPILFVDTFNDDGMIVDEMAYYSDKLLEK